jgi:hypothetical protein
MNRRLQSIALAVLALLVAGGLGLRVALGGKRQPTRAVIVYDRSDSTRDVCAAVLGVAETLLSEAPWPKGSSLALVATGDDETLGEPVELFRYADFRRAKTVEGKAGGARRVRELLAAVASACSRAPRTRTSPIYLAVRRGAEMLSSGCAPERCTLAVISDGEETVEPAMVAALSGGARAKAQASLPPAIPNESARVRFCGFAETVAPPAPPKAHGRGKHASEPKRDAQRADRLFGLWRNVFSRPAGVELSPICPKRKPEVSP